MKVIMRFTIALLCGVSAVAGTQERAPIRPLGPIVAKSTEEVLPFVIRATSSGVLVNEPSKRRVVLFDNTLGKSAVIADSTSATGNAYAGNIAGLIAYKGDSTLFTDPQSMSMLVLDASGKVARVMATPRSQDPGILGLGGASVYDGRGGLIYRGFPRPRFNFGPGGPTPGGPIAPPEIPDSAPLLRVDITERTVDTLTWIRIPKVKLDVQNDNGRISMTSLINPLPTVDDWAVLPDGSIAVLRGKDYHVDWINVDKTKTSAAKIPFDWQRMSDEDKVAFLDSLKAARERAGATPTLGIGGAAAAVLGGGGGAGPGAAGGTSVNIVIGGGGPGGGGNTATGPARIGAQINFIPASELPDYKPPFFVGNMRTDSEGNVWVRTIPTKPIAGGPVYDVINRKGEVFERVQAPANSQIIGFGPGGEVYLTVKDGDKTFLAKAKSR